MLICSAGSRKTSIITYTGMGACVCIHIYVCACMCILMIISTSGVGQHVKNNFTKPNFKIVLISIPSLTTVRPVEPQGVS